MSGNLVLDDLDRMLAKQEQQDVEVNENNNSNNNQSVEIVLDYNCENLNIKGTSINIVGILVDDSKSMRNRGIEKKLHQGLELMIEELKKISREKNTILVIRGYKKLYFCNDVVLADPININNGIECDLIGSPLRWCAKELLDNIAFIEKTLNKIGISSKVNNLLITDGNPEHDHLSGEDFEQYYNDSFSHWKILGMGIVRDRESCIENDRLEFTNTFQQMGVHKIVTPNSDNLKKEMLAFSKSVSVI